MYLLRLPAACAPQAPCLLLDVAHDLFELIQIDLRALVHLAEGVAHNTAAKTGQLNHCLNNQVPTLLTAPAEVPQRLTQEQPHTHREEIVVRRHPCAKHAYRPPPFLHPIMPLLQHIVKATHRFLAACTERSTNSS